MDLAQKTIGSKTLRNIVFNKRYDPTRKLALLASLSNVKLKRIFYLERGQKDQFAIKQKNIKMAPILE